MKVKIVSEEAPLPVGPYSQAVKVGNFVFVSGQIPIDSETGEVERGDIKAQTRLALKNLEAILKTADSSISKVAKLSVFVRNLGELKEVNEVFEQVFQGDYPARETVEVSRLPMDVEIEISAIAEASP